MGNELAQRVAQRNGRTGGDVEQAKPKTLAEQIRAMEEQFKMAMPRGAEARQLIRDALTLLRQNPALAKCTPESVLGGLMTFAQLGLRPGVLGHGWLIPFDKRGKVNGTWQTVSSEAQIVIGYKGLVELVHRSGEISTMVARAVHEQDHFELEYGLNDNLVHRPAPGHRGNVIGYYAIIKYQSGGYVMWHMSRDEALEWRDAHAMSARRDRKTGEITGSGPWFDMDKGPAGGTGFDAMAMKTCALRAMRWAPKATDTAFAKAAEVDGTVRMDVDTAPDAMLNAEHPVRGDVIDGELADDDQPTSGAGPARDALDDYADAHQQNPDAPTEQWRGNAAGPQSASALAADVPAPGDGPGETALQTEFDPVPGTGTDAPAIKSQLTKVHTLLAKSDDVDTDELRHAVLGRMIGLGRPVKSASELTRREASQVADYLEAWDKAGTLPAQLAALAAAVGPFAGAAEPGDLPPVGSSAWHDAGHPERTDGGKVVTVPQLLNGDCGYCEEDHAAGGQS